MKEITFCSHRDFQAEALTQDKKRELPIKSPGGLETSYHQVLHAMRSQETLFYSQRTRSGY